MISQCEYALPFMEILENKNIFVCAFGYRIIVLGELTVAESPDCDDCPKEYRRRPSEFFIHEKYDSENGQSPYDIALIRVAAPMTLFDEDESAVVPVCLPWKAGSVVENLVDDDELFVTGWGKVTNNKAYTRKQLRRFKVSTRKLQKLQVRDDFQ